MNKELITKLMTSTIWEDVLIGFEILNEYDFEDIQLMFEKSSDALPGVKFTLNVKDKPYRDKYLQLESKDLLLYTSLDLFTIRSKKEWYSKQKVIIKI